MIPLIYIPIIIIIVSMCGLGYFAIYRLTKETVTTTRASKSSVFRMVEVLTRIKDIIFGLDQRLKDLETEIKMQKSDSSRLVEWLDKESKTRELERIEFLKALKITERESKIVELGERLRLITTKK